MFKRRVRLNAKQIELVTEMTQAYADIIAAKDTNDRSIRIELRESNRIGKIKRELGIRYYHHDN